MHSNPSIQTAIQCITNKEAIKSFCILKELVHSIFLLRPIRYRCLLPLRFKKYNRVYFAYVQMLFFKGVNLHTRRQRIINEKCLLFWNTGCPSNINNSVDYFFLFKKCIFRMNISIPVHTTPFYEGNIRTLLQI